MSGFHIDQVAQFTSKKVVTPLAAYDASTDVVLNVRGMVKTDMVIKNTGADVTYTVLGSIDDVNSRRPLESNIATWGVTGATGYWKAEIGPTGASIVAVTELPTVTLTPGISTLQTPEYDFTPVAEAILVAPGTINLAISGNYTTLLLRTKSAGAATVTVKTLSSSNA